MTAKRKAGRPKSDARKIRDEAEAAHSWLAIKPRHFVTTEVPSQISNAFVSKENWKTVRKGYQLGHRNISDSLALDAITVIEGRDLEHEQKNPSARKFENLETQTATQLSDLNDSIKKSARAGGRVSRSMPFAQALLKNSAALAVVTAHLNGDVFIKSTLRQLEAVGVTVSASTLRRWARANRS
jgi:hypothetical protein